MTITCIADGFYHQPDKEDTDWDAVESRCADCAIKTEHKSIDDVNYTTYIFADKSSMTFGSNGYLGMQIPANLVYIDGEDYDFDAN